MGRPNSGTQVVTRTDTGAFNAHDHHIVGDATTNDQPALQALVDRLGDAIAADGQPRAIYCPPGLYNFLGNAYGAARFDTAPKGGWWRDNVGIDDTP